MPLKDRAKRVVSDISNASSKVRNFTKDQFDHISGNANVAVDDLFAAIKERGVQNYIDEIRGYAWADRAMDSVFRHGSGIYHSSIHRLFDGNHTLVGATDAILTELHHRGLGWTDAIGGIAAGLWNDFDTVRGLPLSTLSESTVNSIITVAHKFGIDMTKTNVSDLWSINTPEIVTDMFASVSILFALTEKEKEKMIEKISSLSVYSALGNHALAFFALPVVLYYTIQHAYSVLVKKEKRSINFSKITKGTVRAGLGKGTFVGSHIALLSLGATGFGLPIVLPIISSIVISSILNNYYDDAERLTLELANKLKERMSTDNSVDIDQMPAMVK